MPSDFDTFDASQLGAFAESRLHQRNPAIAEVGLSTMVMIWIDESCSGYLGHQCEDTDIGTAQFANDLTDWRTLQEQFMDTEDLHAVQGGLLHVEPGLEGSAITPSSLFQNTFGGIDFPFAYLSVSRPPALSGMQFMFRQLKERLETFLPPEEELGPLHVVTLVDSSGSMDENVIQPGFREFEAWLAGLRDEGVVSRITKIQFGHELWIAAAVIAARP